MNTIQYELWIWNHQSIITSNKNMIIKNRNPRERMGMFPFAPRASCFFKYYNIAIDDSWLISNRIQSVEQVFPNRDSVNVPLCSQNCWNIPIRSREYPRNLDWETLAPHTINTIQYQSWIINSKNIILKKKISGSEGEHLRNLDWETLAPHTMSTIQ